MCRKVRVEKEGGKGRKERPIKILQNIFLLSLELQKRTTCEHRIFGPGNKMLHIVKRDENVSEGSEFIGEYFLS